MTPSPETESVFALLKNPELRELLRRSTHDCLTWEEFLGLPLPQGMSAREAWELLANIRRAGAIVFPIDDVMDWTYWYTPTHRINATLSQIDCMSRHNSPLHKAVTDSEGQQFLVQSVIDESVSSVMLDGLMTPLSRAREMLSLGQAPRTANERLIHNTVSIVNRLKDYVHERFSPELLLRLHEEVLEGVKVSELQFTERHQGFGKERFPEEALTEHADRQIGLICDYANGVTGEKYDHPVVRAHIIREALRGYRPLPIASAAVARIAFSLYAHQNGLPLLSVLPISRAALDWEAGCLSIPSFDSRDTSYAYPEQKEYDLTPYVTITTQLTLQALQSLGADVGRRAERDRDIRSTLQEDNLLNHRQRSILGRALRRPDAEFQIRYHKTKHNIAYATARADLLKLTEMGYLVQEQRGKAFVFVAHPDLKSKLTPT